MESKVTTELIRALKEETLSNCTLLISSDVPQTEVKCHSQPYNVNQYKREPDDICPQAVGLMLPLPCHFKFTVDCRMIAFRRLNLKFKTKDRLQRFSVSMRIFKSGR